MKKNLSEMDLFERTWYWFIEKFGNDDEVPDRERRGLNG